MVHELRSMLEREQIDIVVGPRALSDKGAEVSFTYLVNDPLGSMCRSDHPLVKLKKPSSYDLEQQTWVAHSRGSLLRTQTEAALVTMGLETIHVGFETDSSQAGMEIVASSDMITAMPRETTQPYLSDGLVFLALDHPHFSRPIGVIQRGEVPKNQAVENFTKHFVSSCTSP